MSNEHNTSIHCNLESVEKSTKDEICVKVENCKIKDARPKEVVVTCTTSEDESHPVKDVTTRVESGSDTLCSDSVERMRKDATNGDESFDELEKLLRDLKLYESPAGGALRISVLADLEDLLQRWTDSIAVPPSYSKGIETRVHVCTFGSYRLGAHKPSSDMDVLCFAPSYVTRKDFFSSLVDMLEKDGNVSDTHCVPAAYTPVMKFKLHDIRIDLLFAHQSSARTRTTSPQTIENNTSNYHEPNCDCGDSVASTASTKDETMSSDSSTTDMLKSIVESDTESLGPIKKKHRLEFHISDHHLIGLDAQSIRSVNGVRVAQMLIDVIPSGKIRDYRLVLRTVKEWALVKGIYSNVLGFLGGVNWAILVAKICQMHPDATPTELLLQFFRTFSRWSWPKPVHIVPQQLNPPPGVSPQLVWNPQGNPRDSVHLMPIITPAYPSMNSAYNVGLPQLRRIRSELDCARHIIEHIVIKKTKDGRSRANWKDLFRESDFFRVHLNYLQVNISATHAKDFRTWFGFCESRLRILIASMESPENGIQAYPYSKFFWRGAAAEENEPSIAHEDTSKHIASFFIALRFAYAAENVDLTNCAFEFLQIVNSWPDRKDGMELTLDYKLWNELPPFVFENIYVENTCERKDSNDQTNKPKGTNCHTGQAMKEDSKTTYRERTNEGNGRNTQQSNRSASRHSSPSKTSKRKSRARNNTKPCKKENDSGMNPSRRNGPRSRTCAQGLAKVLGPVQSPGFSPQLPQHL